MAQKVHITIEDDLDGGDATETVSFALDGRSYEIDLNDKNAKAFGNSLEKVNFGDLPIGQNEDVEFSEELADEADKVAQRRAAEADRRAKNGD